MITKSMLTPPSRATTRLSEAEDIAMLQLHTGEQGLQFRELNLSQQITTTRTKWRLFHSPLASLVASAETAADPAQDDR
ncbi:hypothetical protein [Aliidiomarina soli]|uniref:Uncharacterized protein n=1 Tax=Aliidiomarina soli TaxID=1928574 RepID=A0A432WN37_9GAMM|nr:hypothetical protein [Aliidiomarina soli]RUO35107.1 hypothetical protein CWE14_03680 [Aliidiomarina soli]